jgi:hypothetical protein
MTVLSDRGIRGQIRPGFRIVSQARLGLRERSSRFPARCDRKGGSLAAALQSSFRCRMTSRMLTKTSPI